MTQPSAGDRTGQLLPMDLAQALENGPFDHALLLAVRMKGLKLAALERRLAQRGHIVARSTLSYWQQGQRQPERPESRAAVAALEEILGLPDGSLTRLIGAPKPRGRWIGYRPGGREWSEMWEDAAAVQQVLQTGSRRENSKLEDVSVYESFAIGADRAKRWNYTQALVRARESGADRNVLLYRANSDIDVARIELTAVDNCRQGRVRRLPEAHLVAFEIMLGRSLQEGQTHLFSYRINLPAPTESPASTSTASSEDTITGRVFRNPIHSYVLQGEFDPAMLPVRCFWVRRARQGSPEFRMQELTLTSQNHAHFSLESAAPAAHGLRWEWQ